MPVEKDDGCTTNAKLDGMAVEAMAMIGDGDETLLSVASQVSMCNVFASTIPRGPRPTKPAKPTPLPTRAFPPVVPAAPTWTPGTWPAAPTAYHCWTTPIAGGGVNCLCARERYWGQWISATCYVGPITWTCTRWQEVIELESCDTIGGPCPAGGPPPAGSDCNSGFTY